MDEKLFRYLVSDLVASPTMKWHPINWQALGRLKDNWDSYGAKPMDKDVIAKAREMWNRAMQYGERWHAVPGSDGSIQLERHEDGCDIEITIRKAQS
jgi:hypothetical protein